MNNTIQAILLTIAFLLNLICLFISVLCFEHLITLILLGLLFFITVELNNTMVKL
mgnify:CR=1 FL=1